MREAEGRGDQALLRSALEILDANLERGWDPQYGGILYFLDVAGRPPEQLEWDQKLWWPHAEALSGLLTAYALTGGAELLGWYRRVHEYTWALFPDPQYGEWFGYFDRRGNRTHNLKGGKWKGCFHVPRTLLNGWRIAEGLAARMGKTTVIAKDTPGFVTTRLICVLMNEAVHCYTEGIASADDIIGYVALTALIAFGLVWLGTMLGLRVFKKNPSQAAETSLALTFVTLYLVSLSDLEKAGEEYE
jgi:hypothetical protein